MVGKRILALFISSLVVSISLLAASSRAAEINDPEIRLAVLAQTMKQIAGLTGDYSLDCGKGKFGDSQDDVLNLIPASTLEGEYYCILKKGDKMLFGTFADSGAEMEKEILRVYKDTKYSAQIKATDVKDTACTTGIVMDQPYFQECKDALPGLYTYIAHDNLLNTGALYLLVSDSSISYFSQEPGFFQSIIDFFSGIFTSEDTTPLELTDAKFHHAYFSRQGSGPTNRSIAAVWEDGADGSIAKIEYENFAADISALRPENSGFAFGHGRKQVVTMELNPSDEKDLQRWRSMTAGLRIKWTSAAPKEGDVCGNNIAGSDEECDGTDMPMTNCAAYGDYDSGTLNCQPAKLASGAANPNGCMYDTGDCVSCADYDNDGYSGGEGAKGLLVALGSPTKIGTAQPQGPFSEDAGIHSLVNARTRAHNIQFEQMPITFDMMFPQGSEGLTSFNNAVSNAEIDYNSCLEGKSDPESQENMALCENEAYSKAATFAQPIGYAASALSWSGDPRPCKIQDGELICPDGFWPKAVGINDPYVTTLAAFKRMDVTPIIQITLGSCSDNGTCGPFAYSSDAAEKWKAKSGFQTNASEFDEKSYRKMRAYCGVVASSVGGYWNGLQDYPDSDSNPTHYIVIGDPEKAGISADKYEVLYRECRAGINDMLGDGTTVLYGLPSEIALDNNFKSSPYIQNIIGKPEIYDGIYYEQAYSGDSYARLGTNEWSSASSDFKSLKSPLYVRAVSAASEESLYATTLLVMLASTRTYALLYDNAQDPQKSLFKISTSSGQPVEEMRAVTRYWNATAHGLRGTVFYFTPGQSMPNGKALPNGVFAFGANKASSSAPTGAIDRSTITLYNKNDEETIVELSLSDCALISALKVTKDSSAASATFDGKAPAYSIVTLELGKNLSCLSPTDPLDSTTACRVTMDCDDSAKPINPGAPEICGNGVDDNCDGQNDEPGCDDGSTITLPPAVVCDYDGVCENPAKGGQESDNCADCLPGNQQCPQQFTDALTVGKYTIMTRRNILNGPEMIIKTADVACKFTGGAMTRRALAGKSSVLMQEGTSSIELNGLSDKWEIVSEGQMTSTFKTCWGATNTLRVAIAFSSIPQCKDPIECTDGERACGYRTDCCVYPGERAVCADNVCVYRTIKPGVYPEPPY